MDRALWQATFKNPQKSSRLMILTIREILDLIIMVAVLGYLFKDSFITRHAHARDYDPLLEFKSRNTSGLKTAILITAPAVVFHELAHKFAANILGYKASFFAACSSANILDLSALFNLPCTLLVIGVISKILNFGFLFFIPGYVSHGAVSSPLHASIIAFAGPLLNLILWLIPMYLLKNKAFMKKYHKHTNVLLLTSKINMFLFFFNMIPIPPFDGFQIFYGLFQYLA